MGGYYPGVRTLGRDFDHSPPHRANVKSEWSHLSTTLGLYAFME